uniref:Uncharacterized protein n=1 Tax=Rhizophora mucronata TaxID=61149 RepID=A0A2P2PTU2_RHIMU
MKNTILLNSGVITCSAVISSFLLAIINKPVSKHH